MQSILRRYRVDRRKIYFLRFILEGYDGIAGLSTLDARKGLVLLSIPPGRRAEADGLLAAIGPAIGLSPAEPENAEPFEDVEPFGNAEPLDAEPDQAEPDQAEPDQAEPDQAEPDQAEPDQSEPDQSERGTKCQ